MASQNPRLPTAMASRLHLLHPRQEKLLEGHHMRKFLTSLSCALFVFAPLVAEASNAADQTKDDDRLRNCGTVLKEILDVPDNIPQDLLDKADCVVVFPS